MRFRLAVAAAGGALFSGLSGGPLPAKASLFEAQDVPAERFVLVAAPIGTGERAQLNIYEQVKDTRACFATSGAAPAQVEPLLGSFDFTGICSRYIDGNGYSLRVGGDDLATVYRLSVIRQGNDTVLLAAPTRAGAGPEMVVARSGGQGSGFLQLQFEPGWKLMRRHFSGRALGHVYVYRDGWPGAASEVAPAAGAPLADPAAPAAPAAPEAPVTPAAPMPAAAPLETPAPAKPAAPAAPAVPSAPVQSGAPLVPAAPAAPAAPTAPAAPVTPAAPMPTATPLETPAPATPAAPAAPAVPSAPLPSAAPLVPAAPAAPAAPTAPEVPPEQSPPSGAAAGSDGLAPAAEGRKAAPAASLQPASLTPRGAGSPSHPLPPSRRR